MQDTFGFGGGGICRALLFQPLKHSLQIYLWFGVCESLWVFVQKEEVDTQQRN